MEIYVPESAESELAKPELAELEPAEPELAEPEMNGCNRMNNHEYQDANGGGYRNCRVLENRARTFKRGGRTLC